MTRAEREDRIARAVEAVLDEAIEAMPNTASGETFTACHMCGDVDCHAAACPVPALIAWLDQDAICPACDGAGRTPLKCERCGGTGRGGPLPRPGEPWYQAPPRRRAHE